MSSLRLIHLMFHPVDKVEHRITGNSDRFAADAQATDLTAADQLVGGVPSDVKDRHKILNLHYQRHSIHARFVFDIHNPAPPNGIIYIL